MRYRLRLTASTVVHTSPLRVGPKDVGKFAYLPLDCRNLTEWTDVVIVEAHALVTCLGCAGRRA